ncbi:MAG: hypothetical protein M1275_01610 [Patescibacteria group bacterium]|nr:hypothetical protein [Patescibacteria group bacterium]
MKIILRATVLGLASIATAQVQVTADTLGRGKTAFFATGNALVVKDYTTQTFSSVQYWYGAADRIDVFGGIAATTALGQVQFGPVIGANVNLLKSKAFNVSAFNTLTTPFHRRQDACDVLWLTALVVSRGVRVNGFEFTPYTGYAVTVPMGHIEDKLFTPPEPAHNVPMGVMIPRGKFAFFAEYNFGRAQQIAGVGAAYTF